MPTPSSTASAYRIDLTGDSLRRTGPRPARKGLTSRPLLTNTNCPQSDVRPGDIMSEPGDMISEQPGDTAGISRLGATP